MTKKSPTPLNVEAVFKNDEIIVSKTNLKGHITYANDVFCRLAELTTKEVIDKPHSVIRHPDMPRAVFQLLWDAIQAKKEIFAFVKNIGMSGKYYWVLAHVTPTLDANGNVVGYHSNRRKPTKSALQIIEPIYKALLNEEKRHTNKKSGLEASMKLLTQTIKDTGKTYDEFVWSIVN